MLGECENNRQRERVYEFTERILRGGTFPKKAKSGLFVALFSHTLHKTFVEDFCVDETNYSEILTDLINQIEGLLPSVAVSYTHLWNSLSFQIFDCFC